MFLQYGYTALQWASHHGQLAVVEALLRAKADVNAQSVHLQCWA